MPFTPISIRGFHVTEEGPGRFIQCTTQRYPNISNIDVPLVDSIFTSTEGLEIRRLFGRNRIVSRAYYKYVVYVVSRQKGVGEGGERVWGGELIVFRGAVRGEGLVNMRGRDDVVARRIAKRVLQDEGFLVPHWLET